MKGFARKALIGFTAIVILLLPAVSCSRKDTAEKKAPAVMEETALVQINENIREMEVMTPVSQPQDVEGIITFYSGIVSIFDDGSWYEAEIGDFVSENNSIRVESDSYCEVQFGNTAVIKIQENSEINLSKVTLSPGEANVNMDLKLGNVLCKVQKLASDEAFRVKTQTAVCGVRGTEFSVTSQTGSETVLAVKEGAVTVLPKSFDIDAMKEKVSGQGDDLIRIIEKLEREAPVVQANQEIAIDENLVEKTRESARQVEAIVEEIAREEAPAAREEKTRKLETAVDEKNKAVAQNVEPPRALSEKNAENLRQIDEMKLIAMTAPAPAAETQAAPPVPEIRLYKVAVESLTEDTLIEANGRLVGKNRFSGIYEEGETISFNITRTGYQTYTFGFTVTESTARLYRVELKKLPEQEAPPKKIAIKTFPGDADIIVNGDPAGKGIHESQYKIGTELSVTVSKTGYASKTVSFRVDEQTGEMIEISLEQTIKRIAFRVSPQDSSVFVNGKPAGTGSISHDFVMGDVASVEIEKNGYETRTININVTPETPASYTVTLNKKPVDMVLSPFTSKVISRIAYSAGRIFAADSQGNIFSSTLKGAGSWTKTTANSPNANSAPVAAGDFVFFTGAKEMVILDSSTGNIYRRQQLDANSAHMFGRYIVPLGNRFIYPRNNSLLVSTFREGGAEDIINLPVDSGMTPAVWKGKIVLADIEGSVNIIDPATKSVEAKIPTPAVQPIAISMVIFGDTAFFANRRGNVAAVNLAKKDMLWENRINDARVNIFADPCYGGGNLFVFSENKIYPFDMLKGTQPFPPIESTCAPNCSSGKLYYGTADGSLVEADAETGKTIRKVNHGSGAISTRPVFAENRIIAGTSTGKIVILNPAGF